MKFVLNYVFKASDEPEYSDDEYDVVIATPTPHTAMLVGNAAIFAIQISDGLFYCNAYAADADDLENYWMLELSDKGFKKLQGAKDFMQDYISKNVMLVPA